LLNKSSVKNNLKCSTSWLRKLTILSFYFCVIGIMTFSDNIQTIYISNISFMIFILSGSLFIIKRNRIYIDKYIIFLILLLFWILLSCTWAVNFDASISKTITILQLVVFAIVSYSFFASEKNVEHIIKSIFVGGLFMCFYTIYYYGTNYIFESMIYGQRLGNEINQINTMGMYASLTLILGIYYFLYNQKKIYILTSIVSFIIALSSGSRKALIMIIFGTLFLIIFKYGMKKIYKIIPVLGAFILVYTLVMALPMFELVQQRMNTFINIFTDEGKVDNSTTVRLEMIEFGLTKFEKNPFLGYGINNYGILYKQYTGWSTYAHNNYIELLVDIGIVGFLIYYLAYIYLIYKLIHLIAKKHKEALIIMAIILTQILMDFGMVSYYNKMTYVYLTLGYIYLNFTISNIYYNKEGEVQNDI